MTPLRWLIVMLACLPPYAWAGDRLSLPELKHQLGKILDDSAVTNRTTVCLKVIDLSTGEVLFDRGGDRLLTPASNLKIYTASCALDKFGPDKRFCTELRATGRMDRGTLLGDLVLVGGGDSMLTSADLDKLVARAVDQWDLQRILGKVRVDNSRYSLPRKGPGWMWDDDPADYNMSVTPLMLDFNVLTARVTVADNGLRCSLLPPSSHPPIRLAEGTTDDRDLQVTRIPCCDEIVVRPGKSVEPSSDFRLTMHDPGPWAAGVLQRMLEARGVAIQAAAETSSPASQGASEFVPMDVMRHEGITLRETISHLHRVSENAVGEVLLHEIALADGITHPGWPDGARAITTWLTETAGLAPGSFKLVDGSGLSRYNLISADSSVQLLKYMRGHRHFHEFFSSLNTYPVEVPQIASAKGDVNRVHAKSGGMTGVATISGYVQTLDGQLLAFSFLANGFIGSNQPIFELRSNVWNTLVRFRK